MRCSLRPCQARGIGPLHGSRLARVAPARRMRVLAAEPTMDAVFKDFLEQGGATTALQLKPSQFDNGLFTPTAASKGQVLLRVPKGICLVVDYENGLTVPEGQWPRLQQGTGFREPLTWDILQSLALIDGIAGDGGDFWLAYTQQMMPQPGQLTLPVCWEEDLLKELHHDDISSKARKQQERLRALLPGLTKPIEPGVPSYFQWGFACVRSRAFRVGQEAFAFIPFLDQANHAAEPNADFQPAVDGFAYELVAVQDIAAGAEVTISYTGRAGYTNQRLMAQYGFVPAGGNPSDKLTDLEAPQHLKDTKLNLQRAQDALGDQLFMDAVMGKIIHLQAALKSLPFDSSDAAAAASSSEDAPLAPASAAEKELAEALLQQVRVWQDAAPTSLQQDEQLLKEYEGPDIEVDGRLIAAVKYRIERKKLLIAASTVLTAYLRLC